jgi:phospholipid/cholesterol/gamma-HCH transport system substrate-binding protein
MPDPRKLKWSQLKVGVLALAAMLLTAVLILLLTGNGNPFEGTFQLRTYMEDSAGMAEGSAVRLNGILAGKIKKVQLSGLKDPLKLVEIQLEVDERFRTAIPVDSLAGISAANLLGDKYINITKGVSAQHVENGAELKSLQVKDIPQLVQSATVILSSFQQVVNRVDGLVQGVEAGKGNVGKLFKDDELYTRVDDTAKDVNQLVKDVRNSNGTISKLLYDDGLYNDFRKPIQRLDGMLAELQKGRGTAGKLLQDDAVYDEARKSVAELRSMLDDLNAGKGTAGRIIKDEDLYKQLDLITVKVNTALDKINAGQGTIGQLMVNAQLYDSLNGATREAQGLLKEMRANPKKFLRIKLAVF